MKTILSILLLMFFFLPAVSQEYKENAAKYCTGVDFSKWTLEEEVRTQKRASASSPFSVSFQSISKFLKDSDIASLISGAIIFIILGGIILMGALISLIIYLLFCCLWDKYTTSTDQKIKIFCIGSSIGLFVFIIFVILTIITVVNIDTSYKEANCAIAKLPNDLLEGIKTDNFNFIGLKNLKQSLIFFKSEITSLNALTENFTEIVKKAIPDSMTQATSALPQFYASYKDSTVTDGVDKKEKPGTVLALAEEVVSEAIGTEFKTYASIADKIHKAAEEGKNYIGADKAANTTDALDSATAYLDTIITSITPTLNQFSIFLNSSSQYLPVAQTIVLVLSSLVIVLSLVMILILYCMCAKRRCLACSCPFKLCLTLSSLFTVSLSAIMIVIMILLVGVSGFCGFTTDVLGSEDPSSVFATFSDTFTPETINVLGQCFKKDGSADLAGLLNGDTALIGGVQILLDGLTAFKNFKPTLTTTEMGSLTIAAQVEVWDKYRLGVFIDHENIKTTLDEFNNLVNCNDEVFKISATNCTTTETVKCRSIAAAEGYVVPDCSDDEALADTKFKILRTYYTEESALMQRMIEGLSNLEEDTANARFITSKQLMIDSIALFDKIASSLSGTLDLISQFGGSFDEGSNCNIIRTEFENVESAMCFGLNSDLFNFFIYLILASVCAIIMNWFICITFRCIKEESDEDFKQFDDTEASDLK